LGDLLRQSLRASPTLTASLLSCTLCVLMASAPINTEIASTLIDANNLGDLRYARVVNSLIQALSYYKVKLHLISPEPLKPRRELLEFMSSRGMAYDWTDDPYKAIGDVDVLYVVRIQRERFPDPMEYERVRGAYRVDLKLIERAKPSMIIMHPLPRVDEVDFAVDSTHHARYFKQAGLGVPLRMALLKLILGGDHE